MPVVLTVLASVLARPNAQDTQDASKPAKIATAPTADSQFVISCVLRLAHLFIYHDGERASEHAFAHSFVSSPGGFYERYKRVAQLARRLH